MSLLDDPTWAALARRLTPKPRRWATPGAMAVELDPNTRQTAAMEAIDAALVDVFDQRPQRLMVFMPPQEGKSQRISRRFPLWALEQNPDLRIAIVSYSDEMARRWGADIRMDAQTFNGDDGTTDLGIRLREDSRAAGRWQIAGHAGGVYCVGVGGSLTGKPVDGLILDDPIKDLEQANSPVYRERFRRFWRGVALPRLAPDSWVVLVQTRWREDDAAGWLLAENAAAWRVLSIPAVAESDDDLLGRRPGEPLVSTRGRRDWDAIRAEEGDYCWAAMYQQHPAPLEGGLFKRDAWRYWTPMHATYIDLAGRLTDLRDCWRFATVDLAASTKTSADWSVVSAWAIPPGGDCLILLDRARARLGEADHWALLRPLRDRWLLDSAFIEKSFITSTLVIDATRAGLPVTPLDPDADKLTRAIPASALLDAHGIWLPAGAPWLAEWIDEHAGFPNGAHDDQVDTLAYANRVRVTKWHPPVHRPPAPAAEPEIDFMTVAL